MNDDIKLTLLYTWHSRATRASLAHYFQAESCARVHFWLSIFNLLAAISVLYLANAATASGDVNYVSIAGLFVVLSTAAHYVLKFDEKSHDHKSAGNEFTWIKRKIEVKLSNGGVTEGDLEDIKRDYDHTSRNHAMVMRNTWKKISSRVDQANIENQSLFKKLSIDDIDITDS